MLIALSLLLITFCHSVASSSGNICFCDQCPFNGFFSIVRDEEGGVRCLPDHSHLRLSLNPFNNSPLIGNMTDCCTICGIKGSYSRTQNYPIVCKKYHHNSTLIQGIFDDFSNKCPMCTFLINAVGQLRTTAESLLWDQINEICDSTLFLAGQCRTFIEENLKPIQQMLDDHLSPKFICKELLNVCQDASKNQLQAPPEPDGIPEEFDLGKSRRRLTLPAISDQGDSGSCFAQCTRFSIEMLARKGFGSSTVTQLSGQELVDCSQQKTNPGEKKKEAGNLVLALNYVNVHGLSREMDYPNNGFHAGPCRRNEVRRRNKDNFGSGYTFELIDGPNFEKGIKQHLLSLRPVILPFNAPSFDEVKNEVWDPTEIDCAKDADGHCVVITGWGIDRDSGKAYWKVANSYGVTWGEQGYAKIIRGSPKCRLEERAFLIKTTK